MAFLDFQDGKVRIMTHCATFLLSLSREVTKCFSMQKIMTMKSSLLALSIFALFGAQNSQAARVTETVNPYPNFKVYRQTQDELICWAAAAKAVLKMYNPQNTDSVCQIVSKVRNQSCCLPGDGIAESCNQAGLTQSVYSRYNFAYYESGVDFERVYMELKAGRLVNMVINLAMFRNETRRGHVNTIYKAERLKNGQIRFYVGDSGGLNWFNFRSDDVKQKSDGRWYYSSLDATFSIEKFIVVLPK